MRISDYDEGSPIEDLLNVYYEYTTPENKENLVICLARRLLRAQTAIERLQTKVADLEKRCTCSFYESVAGATRQVIDEDCFQHGKAKKK